MVLGISRQTLSRNRDGGGNYDATGLDFACVPAGQMWQDQSIGLKHIGATIAAYPFAYSASWPPGGNFQPDTTMSHSV